MLSANSPSLMAASRPAGMKTFDAVITHLLRPHAVEIIGNLPGLGGGSYPRLRAVTSPSDGLGSRCCQRPARLRLLHAPIYSSASPNLFRRDALDLDEEIIARKRRDHQKG